MNIALVVPQAATPAQPSAPYSSDQGAYACGLGQALADRGHQVVVYARKDAPRLASRRRLAPGLTVRHLTAGPARSLAPADEPAQVAEFARQLAGDWGAFRPDVVHACSWTSGLAALLAARERPVPVVQTFGSLASAEHRIGRTTTELAARARMESLVARNTAGVLAASSDEADQLSGLGVRPQSVRVVPCGVDIERFHPRGRPDRQAGQIRLLQIGDTTGTSVTRALIRLLADIPGAELVIVSGPGQPRRSPEIRKLAAALKVTDRITMTSESGQHGLPELLRSADLAISTARLDPLGLAALRAMACGTPVAAIATGGVADAIVDGTSGLLVPADRPDLLARQVRDLLAWPMKLTAFGVAAADRIRSRYSWQRIADEALAGYCDVGVPRERPEAA